MYIHMCVYLSLSLFKETIYVYLDCYFPSSKREREREYSTMQILIPKVAIFNLNKGRPNPSQLECTGCEKDSSPCFFLQFRRQGLTVRHSSFRFLTPANKEWMIRFLAFKRKVGQGRSVDSNPD